MDQLLSPKGGQKSLLLGNEAIVRGALEAGMAFATCYPGTPSSEVPDNLHRLMRAHPDEVKYKFEYSVNEKVALETAAGAAVTGLRTLCTMKHVGMNVAADPMLTLAYTGVRAGMVILCADDPSLFSSQNEQDNRYYARMSGLPMLEPADPAQAKAMVKYAYELSEKLESPVILRTTTRVNHARSQVEFDDLPETITKGRFIKEPTRFATVPAVSRNLHLRLLRIIEQAKEISEQCEFNVTVGSGKLGVITSGVCVNYVADALDDLNADDKVMVLNLGMSFPLPENKIAALLEACDKVLVVEELEPIVEQAARAIAQERGISVEISGKVPGAIPDVSVDLAPPKVFTKAFEYTPRLVRKTIAETFGLEDTSPAMIELAQRPGLPGRPPNLCSGCPHRATFYAVKEVVGSETIFPSDIGCYTLGMLPPISMADFLICMGSSVSASAGISSATDQKVVAFIGDSTFFHSGITGLVSAVHNQHNFTLIILDNGTTAMTGHQPHPGVEHGLHDDKEHLPLEPLIRGLGVKHVTVIKPLKTGAAIKAIREAVEYDGVSVVISREICPLYGRRVKPVSRKSFQVDPAKCKNHRTCIDKIACPAFYLDGQQAQINTSMCIGCALCAQICPEKAIVPVKEG